MRHVAQLLAALAWTASAYPQQVQTEIRKPMDVTAAKTVYFKDESGVDAVGNNALTELRKWGRLQIVRDPQNADLILTLTTDPHRLGDLLLSGGQTATIDAQGHIEEDPFPTYNKLSPVRYVFLFATDARTGANLWTSSERWGGLLTGFDAAGERLVKQFEKATEQAEQSSRLKVLQRVNPVYPPDAARRQVEGTVVVRVLVDKNGAVSSAKALSGPPELMQATVDAMKQWRFEPPEHPVTTELEMTYGLGPKACTKGQKTNRGTVTFAPKFPAKSDHPGQLKILAEVDAPPPRYPLGAIDAGIEGDLDLFLTVDPGGDVVGARVMKSVDPLIDEAALVTVRTWKFKVTRGEQAGFPITLRYRLDCSGSAAE